MKAKLTHEDKDEEPVASVPESEAADPIETVIAMLKEVPGGDNIARHVRALLK